MLRFHAGPKGPGSQYEFVNPNSRRNASNPPGVEANGYNLAISAGEC